MKAQSTVRKQITSLMAICDDEAMPECVRAQAYEAYHALRWVLEDVSWTPARNLRRFAVELQATEAAKVPDLSATGGSTP